MIAEQLITSRFRNELSENILNVKSYITRLKVFVPVPHIERTQRTRYEQDEVTQELGGYVVTGAAQMGEERRTAVRLRQLAPEVGGRWGRRSR